MRLMLEDPEAHQLLQVRASNGARELRECRPCLLGKDEKSEPCREGRGVVEQPRIVLLEVVEVDAGEAAANGFRVIGHAAILEPVFGLAEVPCPRRPQRCFLAPSMSVKRPSVRSHQTERLHEMHGTFAKIFVMRQPPIP